MSERELQTKLPKVAEDAPAPGACIETPVVYGNVNGRELRGTLYLPGGAPRGLRPAVVYVHGGGWQTGSPAIYARHATALTEKNFAGLCIEYRLSGEAPFPAALEDCKCAVRFLRANAEKWSLNPSRIGAAGDSAGGHLSAMLATTADHKEWEGAGGHAQYSSAVQAAVVFNGVFDMAALWSAGLCQDLLQAFLQHRYDNAPEYYRNASPFFHVDGATPTMLLLHGEQDRHVPIQQSIDFHARLKAAGVDADLIRVPGAAHSWFLAEPHIAPSLKLLLDFFVRRLG